MRSSTSGRPWVPSRHRHLWFTGTTSCCRRASRALLRREYRRSKVRRAAWEDHWWWIGDSEAVIDQIQQFLTGRRHQPEIERVLKTVLFTDIVASTEQASQLGDRRWRELLDKHDRAIRLDLERYRGEEVDTTGDGFLAGFDGPARAIRCAQAMIGAARPLGIEIRAGLHTGECELRGSDLAGIAVHVGARVAALADAGEVLVTSTVRDLVAGSGIEFRSVAATASRECPARGPC